MSIVKYKNQSGQIYAYEQTSYWDPEKKQSRSKRRLLGRYDPDTDEIIPTEKRRGRPKKSETIAPDNTVASDGYKDLYENVLVQLDEAKSLIEKLRSENNTLKELILMIHKKTEI